VFTHLAITPSKVNRFGWNLEHSEYTVWGWPWQILGAIRTVATAWEAGRNVLEFIIVRYQYYSSNKLTTCRQQRPRPTALIMLRWTLNSSSMYGQQPCTTAFTSQATPTVLHHSIHITGHAHSPAPQHSHHRPRPRRQLVTYSTLVLVKWKVQNFFNKAVKIN